MKDVKKVACVGGGVIGSSWALLFAMKGVPTILYDVNNEMIEKAKTSVDKNLKNLLELEAINQETADKAVQNLKYTTDMKTAVSEADMVQESGPERLEIKQSILKQVEEYLPFNSLYVTSASALKVSDIARDAKNPERCIAGHPYNPPHLIPLVEVALGDHTTEDTVISLKTFYESIGKEVVILRKECPGYISNRLQVAITREELDLVQRGVCSFEDAEKAMVYGPGIRWAIFGMGMVLQLSSPGGYEEANKKLAPATNQYLADMADWKELPEEMFPKVQKEIDHMMENYPDYIGHDNETISKYRDKCLVEILKLHHKL